MIFSCFPFYRKYLGANRMSAVKQGNAVMESYAYNHRGERVLRTPTSGTAQITLYDEAGQWLGNYSASVADYVRDTQGRTSGDVMRGGFPSNPTVAQVHSIGCQCLTPYYSDLSHPLLSNSETGPLDLIDLVRDSITNWRSRR